MIVLVEKNLRPDSLYMDCVETLINKPMYKYITSVVGKEDYILVRGGQDSGVAGLCRRIQAHGLLVLPVPMRRAI